MQGRNAEALADDDMAIRLDPKHPLGYVNRGQTLSNLGDRVAALASIDRAMQLAPGFPPALDLLKKIGTGGKPAAEPSAEAAKRHCMAVQWRPALWYATEAAEASNGERAIPLAVGGTRRWPAAD